MSIKDLAAEGGDSLLSPTDARILGALMEKQLATPDAYPLTLNSLLLACNQKTSREPVTSYTQGELQRAVSHLQDRQLLEADYGSRAQRFGQRLTRVLGVDKPVQAILTVLLLRGPQTAAEIFTRTQRMAELGSPDALEEQLQHLCAKSAPLIRQLPRLPGQREARYVHLLCGEPDLDALAAAIPAPRKSGDGELEERVASLENQVQQLQAELAELRARLDA